MTTATFGPARSATLTASPLRATRTTPRRRSVIGRWLVAMLEQAQVRNADHPELAQHVAA